MNEAEACAALGIGGLLLFGLPAAKDEQGTGAWDRRRHRAAAACARSSKAPPPKKLVLIADVCLCEYTRHGHCGVVIQSKVRRDYDVDNDPTLALLARRPSASLAAPAPTSSHPAT